MSGSGRFRVDLQPVGRRAESQAGETLLETARAAGVDLVSLCGGVGICSGCRVRVMSGEVSPVTLEEEAEFSPRELADGWRLACQMTALGDLEIDIPPESLAAAQRLQLEGETAAMTLDPIVRPLDVSLPPPALDDLRADLERLQDSVTAPLALDAPVLAAFATAARAHEWTLRLATREGGTVAAALAPGSRLFGLAVDVGTTGLAAYLVDLETGDTVARTGAMNPQIAYGEDVISRIVYADSEPDGARMLRARLAASVNDMAATLRAEAHVTTEQVVEVVLVGNTVMHHLAAGLPVEQLGEAPYVPVTSGALEMRAAELGLDCAAGARVYMPPLIAGYVGADHVAMLLATAALDSGRTTLAVDVGTNTEMTLVHEGRRLSCSCASGPAFEGAHIRHGMRAAPGAIERVQWIDGALRVQTIDHRPAVGICGSGILDAVAVMAETGAVDARGALLADHPLVRDAAFVLASGDLGDGRRDVTVSRKDVAEVQLAKAAIRTGVDILLAEAGITAEDIESFVIAGAFGTYLRVESAIRVGMFPSLPRERFVQVGNAAGMGACRLLVSAAERRRALELTRGIEYIELTTHPDFTTTFMRRMAL